MIVPGLVPALSTLSGVAASLGLLVPVGLPDPAAVGPAPVASYVVRVAAAQDVDGLATQARATPTARFRQAVYGFAAPLTAGEVSQLRSRPGVLSVEPDAVAPAIDDVTAPAPPPPPPPPAPPFPASPPPAGPQPPPAVRPARPQPPPAVSPAGPPALPKASGNDGPPLAYRQDNPPNWGLDRVDQRTLPLDSHFTTRSTGAGVNIYVLDTGIDLAHPDFGGRAVFEVNFAGGPDTDCDGHGTVVAGIAGSTTYGVAKQATLHSVKVLDCQGAGQLSNLIEGVDWVTSHARKPAVAVLSWRYAQAPSETLTAAVTRLAQSGVFVATSAGNTGNDSCDLAPRDSPAALVVANSTIDDQRASTSSTGSCVSLYAPGSGIRSTVPGGGVRSYSGTSMSAPFAAGVAALYKQRFGEASSAALKEWIIRQATPNVIRGGGIDNTPNRLLYTAGL